MDDPAAREVGLDSVGGVGEERRSLPPTSMEVRVASLTDVPLGQPLLVEAEGTPVVLVRVGDSVYACSDMCTHQGGPLSEGKLSGTRLSCPWHGWMFDVKTGQCVMPSRGGSVPSYPTRVDESGGVWVALS